MAKWKEVFCITRDKYSKNEDALYFHLDQPRCFFLDSINDPKGYVEFYCTHGVFYIKKRDLWLYTGEVVMYGEDIWDNGNVIKFKAEFDKGLGIITPIGKVEILQDPCVNVA